MKIILVMFFFILLVGFILKTKHLLSMLITLEMIILILMFMFFLLFIDLNYEYYNLFFLFFMMVSEGALGLSIMISLIRSHGNELMSSFVILSC